MSKTRKVLGIILAVVLTLNVMAIAVFAANDSDRLNTWTLESNAFTTEPTVGNTFTVDLKLLANYNLGPVQFALEYDNTSFGIAENAIDISGYPYEATVNYNYVDGKLRVVIVPDTSGLTTLPAVKLPTATTIATITFTYLKGGTIEVADDYKTDENINGTLCAFRSTKDDLLQCEAGDLRYGQTPTITAGDHEIGSSYTAPVFQKKATAAEGIQINRNKTIGGAFTGVVYGFPQAAANTFANQNYLINAFEVVNGTMEISKYAGFGAAGRGTGTVLTIKDSNGVVKETYIVVIFGDLDGNGLINATDLGLVSTGAGSASYFDATAFGRIRRMAANLQVATNANLHNLVNANDISAHATGTSGGAYINQAALAASHTNYAHAVYA